MSVQIAPQNLKDSTLHFYTDNIENHLIPLMGTLAIDRITRADVRELIAKVCDKGLKLTTVRGIVRTLSTLLSQAVEDGLLSANPALRPGRYLRRGNEPKSEIDPFTSSEVSHVIEMARSTFPTGIPSSCMASEPGCDWESCWRCSGSIWTGSTAPSTSDRISYAGS
jgi:hypothetical protein